MHGGEDGLPLVLLVEFPPRPPALGEGRGVHEAPQVEVLLKVCQPVFHLIVIEKGLHISDLDICLERYDSLLFTDSFSIYATKRDKNENTPCTQSIFFCITGVCFCIHLNVCMSTLSYTAPVFKMIHYMSRHLLNMLLLYTYY